jgi:hypothetical protein
MLAKMISLLQADGKLVLVLHSKTSPQLELLTSFHERVFGRPVKHICAENVVDVLKEANMNPRMFQVTTECRIPNITTACALSHFLLRVEYSTVDASLRAKIRQTLSERLVGQSVVVRSLHGIVVASK